MGVSWIKFFLDVFDVFAKKKAWLLILLVQYLNAVRAWIFQVGGQYSYFHSLIERPFVCSAF